MLGKSRLPHRLVPGNMEVRWLSVGTTERTKVLDEYWLGDIGTRSQFDFTGLEERHQHVVVSLELGDVELVHGRPHLMNKKRQLN
jgi:hypothetical protein